ncbi:MAG: hypothetical protein QF752_13330 [Planctomycetota bacterium]|jgi:hypothetical protein|nr:hypothetical protein [Planctomycetota bacterium]
MYSSCHCFWAYTIQITLILLLSTEAYGDKNNHSESYVANQAIQAAHRSDINYFWSLFTPEIQTAVFQAQSLRPKALGTSRLMLQLDPEEIEQASIHLKISPTRIVRLVQRQIKHRLNALGLSSPGPIKIVNETEIHLRLPPLTTAERYRAESLLLQRGNLDFHLISKNEKEEKERLKSHQARPELYRVPKGSRWFRVRNSPSTPQNLRLLQIDAAGFFPGRGLARIGLALPPRHKQPIPSFEFQDEYKATFSEFTRVHSGRSLAIVSNDQIVHIAPLEVPLPGGSFFFGMNPDELRLLNICIRSGPYPVRIRLLGRTVYEATLDNDPMINQRYEMLNLPYRFAHITRIGETLKKPDFTLVETAWDESFGGFLFRPTSQGPKIWGLAGDSGSIIDLEKVLTDLVSSIQDFLSRPPPTEGGGESPQDVLERFVRSFRRHDLREIRSCFAPKDQTDVAFRLYITFLFGSSSLEEPQRNSLHQSLRELLKKNSIEDLPLPELTDEPARKAFAKQWFKNTDQNQFLADLIKIYRNHNSLPPPPPSLSPTLVDLKIEKNRATGQSNKKTLHFILVDGRWFLEGRSF